MAENAVSDCSEPVIRRMSRHNAIEAWETMQKTAYEINVGLVGSEMCIRDSPHSDVAPLGSLIRCCSRPDRSIGVV